MKSISELKTKAFKIGLSPIKKISVSEWADKYRILPTTAAEPGKWKTSRAPYAKEIMDAFTQEGIYKVAVMSASQIGKTEALLNLVGRFVHVDPCNMMFVIPTLELAQDFSKDRLEKLISDTKVLTSLFYRDGKKSRDKNQTMLSKFFTGGRLVLTGANSSAGLASRPIRILLCDEVDRFPASASGGEGDPISLAAKRTQTYWNRKIGLFSTPTTKGASRIEVEFLAGTQEKWMHACPNCKEFHILDWRQMKIDFDALEDSSGNKVFIVKNVLFRCPDCGMEFSELEMKNAPQKYIAFNPEAASSGVRSFWLNAFSSPWTSWKDIMREWLEAKGDNVREQVVTNTLFGESFEIKRVQFDENEFLSARIDYPAEIPHEVKILTCAVDVQHNRLEFEVVGWANGFERYGIWRGVILGAPNNFETWDQLNFQVINREYNFSSGRRLKIARTFIDSGYSTRYVYEFCRRNFSRGVFPIKGRGGSGLPLISNYSYPRGSGVVLIVLGVNDGKADVMASLQNGLYHFPTDDNFINPRGYDQIYFKQLLSEERVIKKFGGVAYVAWQTIKTQARNESLDLAVYNLAAIKSLNPDFENIFAQGEEPPPKKKNIETKKPTPRKIAQSRINFF